MIQDQTFMFATGIECSNPMVQGHIVAHNATMPLFPAPRKQLVTSR